MRRHTSTWKDLEKDTALAMGGKRIQRLSYSEIKPDVDVPDFPSLKIDSKRYKRFSIFSLYEKVKTKYCQKLNDKPILVIRESNKHYILAVIDLKLLAQFLNYVRSKNEQNAINDFVNN
jgi:hypothetical protein